MKRTLAILVIAGILAIPSAAWAKTTRWQALHSRASNAQRCSQNWHTLYGNKRMIACEAALRRLPVRRVVCVARRESGFHANEVYGRAYGTFQHIIQYWAGRWRRWAARFHFYKWVLNGRTNAFVSVAIMASMGINRALGPNGPWYSTGRRC